MSLSSSTSAQFAPIRRSPLPSTHSLATLANNNNHHLNNNSAALEPVLETTPLTNGGAKLKRATVPVPDPQRPVFREQSVPPFVGSTLIIAFFVFAACGTYRVAGDNC
ncbi:hypothetical protein Q1695_001089 [Nippostrongylus brasiliensis]|nr:hypothetical protein Q1695_001089 [Nippostrongylus brasiliensis]